MKGGFVIMAVMLGVGLIALIAAQALFTSLIDFLVGLFTWRRRAKEDAEFEEWKREVFDKIPSKRKED